MHSLNSLQLLGRRRVSDTEPQRAYFLTPADTITYYDLATKDWHDVQVSVAAFLYLVAEWIEQDQWVSGFTFHAREADLRARLGIDPIPMVSNAHIPQHVGH